MPGGADLDTIEDRRHAQRRAGPRERRAVRRRARTRSPSRSRRAITPPNKYGYLFQVQDTNGDPATPVRPVLGRGHHVRVERRVHVRGHGRPLPRRAAPARRGRTAPPTDPVGDWKGGDFGGVTQKINAGYFDAMGVNTLWLSSPVLGTKLCEMGAGANTGHCLSGYHSYFPIASGWTYGSENDPLFTRQRHHQPHRSALRRGGRPRWRSSTRRTSTASACSPTSSSTTSSPTPSPPERPGARSSRPLAIAHQTDLAWFNIPYSSGINDCGNENLWDTADDPDLEPRRLLVRPLPARPQHDQPDGRRRDRQPRRVADGAVQPRRLPRRRRQAGEQRALHRHALQDQRGHLHGPALLHGGRGARRRAWPTSWTA